MKIYYTFSISIFLLFSLPFQKNYGTESNNQEKITIKSITERIQKEKKDISLFIGEATKTKTRVKLYEYQRANRLPTEGISRQVILFKREWSITEKNSIKYTSKKNNNDSFSVMVKFKEHTRLENNKYSYSFRYLENYNPYANFTIKNNIKIGKKDGITNYSTDASIITKLIQNKLLGINFCKSKSVSKSEPTFFKVEFTTAEINFLSKDSNYKLLEESLKKINLL
jgi:hypothetical protein